MKLQVNKSELQTNDDIWNAVLAAYVEYVSVFPTEDEKINDFIILFNYYCELESGGHESLLNWFSEHIEAMGIQTYLHRLTNILEKIGASNYAVIEKNYLEELWRAFLSLETSSEDPIFKSLEVEFYDLIEKADAAYFNLDQELSELLSDYATKYHEVIMEIVE